MIKYQKVNFNNIDTKVSELRSIMEFYTNKVVAVYLIRKRL